MGTLVQGVQHVIQIKKDWKYEMRINRKSNIVTITEVGHRMWRKDFLMAAFFFNRYVPEADSQFGAENKAEEGGSE